jgi:hypothetical protein
MDALFHFIFPLLIIFASGIHRKIGWGKVALLALISMMIDIDHFFPIMIFHTLLFAILFQSFLSSSLSNWSILN